MGIYDVIKKMSRLDVAELTKGIDECFHQQEHYRHLKKGELENVSDEDLSVAVMSWMWSRVNGSWLKEKEIIESMPEPCRNVYACRTVVDEVNNGGFNQLFLNSTRQFAVMAQKGFIALGNEKLSKIIEDAISLYRDIKQVLDKYSDVTIDSFSASNDESLFERLDNEFSIEEPGFEKLLISYIRANSDSFGD